MDSATTDLFTSVVILSFTSAVATNAVTLPSFLTTTVSGAILLLLGLLLSMAMPLAGISTLILAIIVFFRRNMDHTIQGSLRQASLFQQERAYPPTPAIYGEVTIPMAKQNTSGYEPTPSGLAQGGPREYTNNLGLLEGFAPATIEQSEEVNPPKGQYRTDESRQTAEPVSDMYTYRPSPDTGSNEFQRFGPQMDKKVDSFRYYA
jgi:hypothetical protein